jgi:hypothetical protein
MIGCGLTAMLGCGKGDTNESKGAGPDAARRADAAVQRCGDGICSTSEIGQCPVDCGGGNGSGSGGGGTCNNDGTCENAEINQTPPCADCTSQTVCDGDGTCESGENSQNCGSDCPAGPCNNNGACDAGEDGTCADCPSMPGMCTSDAQCTVVGECCGLLTATCGKGTVTPFGCLPI